MPTFNTPTEIGDTLSAPLGEFIASIGKGVAEAQQAMDLRTVEAFKEIYQGTGDTFKILQSMGYQPTWYKIPEVEAKITLSLNISGKSESTGKIEMYATPMDAGYANKYDYNLQAASQLTFKIVPVPPSPKAEEMKVVPDLNAGIDGAYRYKVARSLLESVGITHEVKEGQMPKDDYFVRTITPSAGEVVFPGQKVILELAEKI